MSENQKMTNDRIIGVDLARAVALIGMAIINFNVAMDACLNGPTWLVWLTEIIQGRAAALFVFLAGVGMSLMSNRARKSDDVEKKRGITNSLYRRAFLLFFAGLLFQTIWDGDILHYYGVFIVIGTLMLFVSSSWIMLGAIAANAGFFFLFLVFSYNAGWDWERLDYPGFWTVSGFSKNLLFNGWHPVFPWLGFMLLGMWIGRLNLLDKSVRMKCMFWGCGVALLAELVSWFMVEHLGLGGRYTSLFGRSCIPPNPLFCLAAGGGTVFLTALCIEVGERFRKRAWVYYIAVFGQFSLSVYIGHIALFILPLVNFAEMKNETLISSSSYALITCIFWMVFCAFWTKKYSRGPLEIIFRRFATGGSVRDKLP